MKQKKQSNPYQIYSNQTSIHPKLPILLEKYKSFKDYQHPVSSVTKSKWQRTLATIDTNQPIILDSGCGRGLSTLNLAQYYPKHNIIAVDQSSSRLQSLPPTLPENVRIIEANIIDIWKLCWEQDIRIEKNYVLYPNPWPKKKHIQRRWYAHPIFPLALEISKIIELRTNWYRYLQEWVYAGYYYHKYVTSNIVNPHKKAITHFEKKYFTEDSICYRAVIYQN
ncbi:MAG: hypothetical protein VX112_04075 [Pseudomonadota bacterium]|nr:hypothetical protein [Pseudomonadota bacterium]